MTIISRGSLIIADAIALSVTWYNLGTRKTSVITGMSLSRILLRDGEILRMDSCQSIQMPVQDQYTFGTLEREASHFVLAYSDTF